MHRLGAEQLEAAGVDLAVEDAQPHAGEIGGRAHRPQRIRNMPEAVLEKAEHAAVHLDFDVLRKKRAEGAVDGGARGGFVLEQKRQVGETQFGNGARQTAGGLI